MNWKEEGKKLFLILTVFAGFFYLPVSSERLHSALAEALFLAHYYAREHVILCLIPAFFIAGFLLGRPGHEGIIPSGWVEGLVGGNSLRANAFAGVAGAFMYFATLTEIPILEGLIGAGMGNGPALAVDGEVKLTGKVANVEEVKALIS